jgi:hypothetical protein
MHDEQHIRQRAYEIWEQAGRPDGREDEHWALALREIEAEGLAQAATAEAPEDSSSTVTAPDGGRTTPGQAAAVAAAVDTPTLRLIHQEEPSPVRPDGKPAQPHPAKNEVHSPGGVSAAR